MKKSVIICDCCKKQISKWLKIYIIPGTTDPCFNISDLMEYCGEMHVCKEGFVEKFEI